MTAKFKYKSSLFLGLLLLLLGCSKAPSEYSDKELVDHFVKYSKELQQISPKSKHHCNISDAKLLEFVLLDEIAVFGNENYDTMLNRLVEDRTIMFLSDLSPSLQYINYINRVEPDLAPIILKRLKSSASYRDYVLFNENQKSAGKFGTKSHIAFLRNKFSMNEDFFSVAICLNYIFEYDLSNPHLERLSTVIARELLIEMQKKSIKLSAEIEAELRNLEQNFK